MSRSDPLQSPNVEQNQDDIEEEPVPVRQQILDNPFRHGGPSPAPGVAGLLEKVRLLCTVYDPRSGAYRLNVGLFIELLSGLSVIGYVLINEWRRNRKVRDA